MVESLSSSSSSSSSNWVDRNSQRKDHFSGKLKNNESESHWQINGSCHGTTHFLPIFRKLPQPTSWTELPRGRITLQAGLLKKLLNLKMMMESVPHSHQLLRDSPHLDDDPLLKWFDLQVRSIHFIYIFCQSSVLLLQVSELLICLNGTQER